jgi:3-hydroxyacyl-CoA dehydrogenase
LGERVVLPRASEQLLERGWLGRKTGRGFYVYPPKEQKGAKPRVNDEVVDLIATHSTQSRELPPDAMQDRVLLPMVNEAARLLGEGVADSADAIDTATLLGMGFPQFRGGLAAYADSVGAPKLLGHLEHLAARHGVRYQPAPLLPELAQNGATLSSYRPGK